MKVLLGTKQHMTQFFDEDGNAHAATVVDAGPMVVTHVRTSDKDGYSAIQVGYGTQKESRVSKPLLGHLGNLGPFRYVREFQVDETPDVGAELAVDQFEVGDTITVSGTSKAKGFQGVVKRHGFAGGRRSHGQKHSEREPGSIGATGPQRVFKGTKMGGRMGGDRVTVKNLKVLAVDPQAHTMVIKGAVPGRRGTLVEIRG